MCIKTHPLKVYSSVNFSILTKLYSHDHYLITEHFIALERNPMHALWQSLLIPSSFSSPGNHSYILCLYYKSEIIKYGVYYV